MCQNSTKVSGRRTSNALEAITLHHAASKGSHGPAYFANLDRVQRIMSRPDRHYSVSLGPFAEYSPEDILRIRGGYRRAKDPAPSLPTKELEVDPEFISRPHLDWRIKGAIGFVKDQVSCGSCWTFATIGVLESRINIKRMQDEPGAPLLVFSE